MELRNHQKEALQIIQKIWKSDIDIGTLYYAPAMNDNQKKTLGNIYPGEFVSSYAYYYFKTVGLLEKSELIVFKKNPFMVDTLQNGCPFQVTDKCKNVPFEDLERLIIKSSGLNEDPTIGEFKDVELKMSGEILYKKLKRGQIKEHSNQYLLLMALIIREDKNMIATIEELKNSLNLPTDKADFLYKEKTYENLNQNLHSMEVPIRVRKHGEGYKLDVSDTQPLK